MSEFTMFCLIFSLFLWVTVTEQAELCRKVSSCSCRNSDGLIDLSPLAKSDGPAFKDYPDPAKAFDYSWNPCNNFTEGSCNEVAACQKDTASPAYYTIGNQDAAQFIVDATEGLQIQYTSGPRTLYVTLKCDRQGGDKLDVKGENPKGSLLYYMTLHSKHACPGGSSSSFSIGTIIVIAFFGVVILYFLVGMAFQKFIRKASGIEIIPNYTLWSWVVGSIHTGVLFVFRCGKDRRFYAQV